MIRNRRSRARLLGVILGVMALVMMRFVPEANATASTIVWGPSTDIQAYKTLHLTSDIYVPSGTDTNEARPSTVTNVGLTAGILPFKKVNAEVGFDVKSGTGLDDHPVYFNGKVGIPENTYGSWFPGLAAGIYDIGTDSKSTDFNVGYFRVAKTLSTGDFSVGRFSAGAFMGNEDLLTYNGKESNEGILLGWERTLSEISDKWWMGIDYQGSKSAYGALNFGVAYSFSSNTSVIFGYDVYNNKDLVDTYTVQLDINF